MPICYNCLRDKGNKRAGYTFSFGTPTEIIWFCPDCSKCVICGPKGDLGAHPRLTTLDYNSQIASAVFYCREHDHLYLETIGLKYNQMPKDRLQRYVEYLTYQRVMMIEVNAPLVSERLELVNGLIHLLNGIISPTTRGAQNSDSGGQSGVIVKETVREIVKMPCRYCGTFSPVTEQKCSSCGAPLLRRWKSCS